jgi:rubrerythrin
MEKMLAQFLADAFAGESQARMKYTAFAAAAEKEGLKNIARLFLATAFAEQVHAINHAKILNKIGPTVKNLEAAIEGETFEVEQMYAAYDLVAKNLGDKAAEKSIRYALEAEKLHADYYKKAKDLASSGKDMGAENIYVCGVCGHTHVGELEGNCPICGATKDHYTKF